MNQTSSDVTRLIEQLRAGDEPVHAQLFWSTRDQQGQAPYSEDRSVHFELSPSQGDWREFEVLFEAKVSLTGLRLDPGAGSRLEIDSIILQTRQE